MPDDKAFFDTNVVLYALSNDPARKERVADLLCQGGILSTQVLMESANVMRRKWKHSEADIEFFWDSLIGICPIQTIDLETLRQALKIVHTYGFSVYDSLIVATALQAHCNILYSEDMQHRQKIEGDLIISV